MTSTAPESYPPDAFDDITEKTSVAPSTLEEATDKMELDEIHGFLRLHTELEEGLRVNSEWFRDYLKESLGMGGTSFQSPEDLLLLIEKEIQVAEVRTMLAHFAIVRPVLESGISEKKKD